jgi:hypothetical protein
VLTVGQGNHLLVGGGVHAEGCIGQVTTVCAASRAVRGRWWWARVARLVAGQSRRPISAPRPSVGTGALGLAVLQAP